MKIAVWHNLPSGGGKRALYDHVRGLVARGHHVECWCPPTADQSYLPLSDLVRENVVPLAEHPTTQERLINSGANFPSGPPSHVDDSVGDSTGDSNSAGIDSSSIAVSRDARNYRPEDFSTVKRVYWNSHSYARRKYRDAHEKYRVARDYALAKYERASDYAQAKYERAQTRFREAYGYARSLTSADEFLAQHAFFYHKMARMLAAMDQHSRRCAEEINTGDFDVLFANACMFYRTSPVAKYAVVPSVLYLQEPYRPLYEAMPRLPWLALDPSEGPLRALQRLRRAYHNLVEVQAYRLQAREELNNARAFDSILVNSLFSRESVLRAYGLDARVCYLGIDQGRFVENEGSREDFIVGIGAFAPEKNIGLVIQALGKVRQPRPQLVWIGNEANSSYLDELNALARSLQVKFEPKIRIDDSYLADLLGQARMMVYAPRLEPFGFAPLEANACGTPVVAVAEGGVRETVVNGENGLLVNPDAAAIAAAIERLLDDPNYARRLGHQGRLVVSSRWSLDAAIDRLEHNLVSLTGVSKATYPMQEVPHGAERDEATFAR